jgi:hypothetical protein
MPISPFPSLAPTGMVPQVHPAQQATWRPSLPLGCRLEQSQVMLARHTQASDAQKVVCCQRVPICPGHSQ